MGCISSSGATTISEIKSLEQNPAVLKYFQYYNESALLTPLKPVPKFSGTAYFKGEFKEYTEKNYENKYFVLIFFGVLEDFVSISELANIEKALPELTGLNTDLLACSLHSQYSLFDAFTNLKAQGLSDLSFPILSDLSHKIFMDFGLIYKEPKTIKVSKTKELVDEIGILRGTFIIDSKGNIRHTYLGSPNVGRNIDDIVRLVEAFKYSDEHGEVCPANWKKGEKGLKANVKFD